MKNTTKMMVVAIALLLATALLVAPAVARYPGIGDIKNGDTIFVYEKSLNVTGLNGSAATDVTAFRRYSEDNPSKALLNEIPVDTATNFELLEAAVSGQSGVYYAWNGTAVITGNGGALDYQSIVIRQPALTADVRLWVTTATPQMKPDSLDGKTVTKDTLLAFKVGSQVGSYYRAAGSTVNATVKVEITTPGGAKLTSFGGLDLASLNVSSSEFNTTAAVLTDVAAGTYTAQVKWVSPDGFSDYAASSNTASFTVESRVTSITSNKDTLVRGNNFVVTIAGESSANYTVFVKNAETDGDTSNPGLTPGQPNVLPSATKPYYTAFVMTNAAGTRPIEFNTTANTKDKTFTIRVEKIVGGVADTADYDEVKVKVEKGGVSVTASGTGSYYIGEEIKLTGTNTETENTYFFITGPNLASKGVNLTNIQAVTNNTATTFDSAAVKTDDTYEKRWDTSNVGLDAGSYTIYAVSAPRDRDNLANVQYATVSIVVKKPFVSATTSASTVAKGDKLFVRGTAEGKPTSGVQIWFFGKNYYDIQTTSVNDDSTFEHEVTTQTTKDLASGQYFVVVQHPMQNDRFDVVRDTTSVANIEYAKMRNAIISSGNTSTDWFVLKGAGRLQGSDAAQALIDLLNNANIDDTYAKLTFLVEEPWIRIDTVNDKYVGSQFSITGTTNLAVDNDFLIDVLSSAFKPTEKTTTGEFAGQSGTIKVTKGDAGYNTWSFEVDTSSFLPDEYIVKVESIEAGTTATTTFNVLEGVPVTQPPATPVPTTPPATVVPTQPPATPASPGFGALVAIAGLGAVAFLVLRRD
ncbi:MEMAR_RS02690 family S-layer glycoprotein [Methanocalculus sp. MC3]